ncbi:hypothetical protein BXZ70DRAFT_974987 [Cristinia sonorae]|uniref:AB hydrolase-1 domain-containing protein n=1 Tax=Cristinia sonorae TaxID=1940300 RepID=A0A8K0XNA5_9AGAR|nr:hypothetical protein BXZ70DRAFT_974987 [Cristinia sonorae]
MPLAPVDATGIQLHYEDSGAPPGCTVYTTVLFIHGIYFNGGIFKPMFPYAAQNNLRFVSLDARDNGGSTLFSEEELKQLRSPRREDQEAFVKQRVFELAAFLHWYIEQEKIPPLQEQSSERIGGISLACWSAGNSLGVSFLAHADVIPQTTRTFLERYLRSYIIYDPPMSPFGIPMPPSDELYSPARDPMLPLDRMASVILPYLIGHYNNDGPLTYQAFRATNLAEFPSRHDFCRSLDWKPVDGNDVNPADFESITELQALTRSAIPSLALNPEIFATFTDRLVDDGEHATEYFPKVTLECVVGSRTISATMYAVYALKGMVLQREAAGRKGRKIAFHVFDGANHAWHWLRPEPTAAFFGMIV